MTQSPRGGGVANSYYRVKYATPPPSLIQWVVYKMDGGKWKGKKGGKEMVHKKHI